MANQEETGFDLTVLDPEILEETVGKVCEKKKWYTNNLLDELIKAAETEVERIEKLGIKCRMEDLKSFVETELTTRKITQTAGAVLTTVGAVLSFTGVFTGPAILMSAAGMGLGIGSSVIGGIILKNNAFQELLAAQVEQGQDGSWNSELKRIQKKAEHDAEKICDVMGWKWDDEHFKKSLIEAVMLYGDKVADGFLVYKDLVKKDLVSNTNQWALSGVIQLGVMCAATRIASEQALRMGGLVRGSASHRAATRAMLRSGLRPMMNRMAARVGVRVQARLMARGIGRGVGVAAGIARGAARTALYSAAFLGPMVAIGATALTFTENNAEFNAACDKLVNDTTAVHKEMKDKVEIFANIKKDQNDAWGVLEKQQKMAGS